MIGNTISHYRIIDKLGQGGMGEVFLARDSILDRSVALKLLPENLSRNPESLARFEREARLLGSLNHTNIATVYGLEQSEGKRFLIMELVGGETLAQRIARGALPLKEALEVCRQIAEGLEAAHEKNIIHRDLKPANVKITEEGKVKVLDFGLAKVLEADPGSGDGVTQTLSGVTRQGIVLGTMQYMSPEQACGKPLDPRTDIWSFGCVMYEALTGTRTFEAATAAELLGRILERDPDWSLIREPIPANIRSLLRRCLQRDPHHRLRSIADARIELEDTLEGRIPVTEPPKQGGHRRGIWAVALTVLLAGAAGTDAWLRSQAPPAVPQHVARFTVDLAQGEFFNPSWNPLLRFSPDGNTLAYSPTITNDRQSALLGGMSMMMLGGGDSVMSFLRPLDGIEAKPVVEAPMMAIHAFSPDGRYILLQDDMHQVLKKAALSGGAPLPVAPVDMAFRGEWAPDGYYYFTNGYFSPIVRIPISGGKQEGVTSLDLEKQERSHRHAQMLPDGKAIMFTVSSGGIDSFDDARIDAFTLDSKKRKTLVQGGFCPRYSPSGHIIYARGGSLYAVPFDPKTLEATGSPVKIVDGVFMSTNTGAAQFDVSATGALAYLAGKSEGGKRTLVWVDRQGRETALPLPPRSYVFPRISPDGRQLAFEVEGVNHDLYEYDLDREVVTKVTTDGLSHAPVWTPDGKHIAFRSWKAGTMTMWMVPSDRSGPEERLSNIGERQSVVAFSEDGRYLSYNQMDTGMTGNDIWIMPMQGDRKPQPLVKSRFSEGSARFSPDGQWVAYCTDEPGENEVYVQRWPGPGSMIKISSEGGSDPIWSRNGKGLFYRNGDKMMVVAVATQPTFRASKPQVLWTGHYSRGMSSSCGPPGTTEANYDVTGDGQRFLMIRDVDADAVATRIVIVLNFAEELRRRAQEKR